MMAEARGNLDTLQPHQIKSVQICWLGSEAVGYFTGVLITSASLAISFYMLPLKNSDSLFQLWYVVNKIPIFACFVGLMLGLNKLYEMNHNMVDVIYPIYDESRPVSSYLNSTGENLNVKTMISQTYAYNIPVEIQKAFIWVPVTVCSVSAILWMVWAFLFPRSKFLQGIADFSLVDSIQNYFARKAVPSAGQ
jgi:hypothetical protein